jgi:hypothetical protein
MSMDESQRHRQDNEDEYRRFERRMELFEHGPTTTNFQQLLDDGVELPEPDSILDADVGPKLWQLIHALARRRAYINETDHLSDRELYRKLWHEVLRVKVEAIDLIGFNTHVSLLSSGDEHDTWVYLKYFADDTYREGWLTEFPDYDMPAHEDPPYNRDWRLPTPYAEPPAEAREWLRENRNPSAFATNRFSNTTQALDFVDQLYTAGALRAMIENICVLRAEEEGPYADSLTVILPGDSAQRRDIFRLIEEVGRPDNGDAPFLDGGQESVLLWWD